jgi:hypothetical protein
MLRAQTLQPVAVELINFTPIPGVTDITKRYRIGYEHLKDQNLDVIVLWENDDFYHPEYIETMTKMWDEAGRPDLLGQVNTIYYHIKLFRYFYMNHPYRSSAMNTLIKPDLDIKWCPDSEVFTDVFLWNQKTLSKKLVSPEKRLCLGIKHGEGLCGGLSHNDKLHRYILPDENKSFLSETMDDESFKFYTEYFNDNALALDRQNPST